MPYRPFHAYDYKECMLPKHMNLNIINIKDKELVLRLAYIFTMQKGDKERLFFMYCPTHSIVSLTLWYTGETRRNNIHM